MNGKTCNLGEPGEGMGLELVQPGEVEAEPDVCRQPPGYITCPNCKYEKAIRDKDGRGWCPACGWSSSGAGRYT